MAERTETAGDEGAASDPRLQHGRPPFMQRLLDNPFLLLFIGITLPTVLYILWGVMEIAQIPLSPS